MSLSFFLLLVFFPHSQKNNRRCVRLRKGFVNMEKAPFGGMKLRIPSLLFIEKMRTQSRFNVSRHTPHAQKTCSVA